MTPKYHGRDMKFIKDYGSHVLYEDPLTKVRECFTKAELKQKEKVEAMIKANMNHIPRID